MPNIKVDPRIRVKVVPDGEIHITFAWNLEDLEQLARAYLAMSDGKAKQGDIVMAFRLKNKEAVDYLIDELNKAKLEPER